MNKKVLHVFGIMNRGGAELRTLDTLPGLQEKGVKLEFCALSGQPGVLDERIRRLGSKVHHCKLDIGFFWRFYRLLRKEQFDTVHSHVAMVSGLILLIARLAGVRQRIAHFRNTQESAGLSRVKLWRNKLLRICIDKNADRILGVCKAALSGFWGAAWKADNRCKVIYNGLKCPQLPEQDKSFWQDFEINPSYPVFINVARMDEQKNHARMVDILAEYHAAHGPAYLVFIGKENAERKAQLKEKIAASGLRAYVVFASEQADVYPFLFHADAMLFPSLWEGLPGAVIEAASAGLPVLASDIPGVLEIAETLSCVKPYSLERSDKKWANSLHAISHTEPEQRAMFNQQFAQCHFNLSRCVDELYAVYQ